MKKICIIVLLIILIIFVLWKKCFINISNQESFSNQETNSNQDINTIQENNTNQENNCKEIKCKNDFEVEKLHSKPDIFLIKNFLTEDECDHIIKVGDPHIKPSEVCGQGGSKTHKSRTSMTAHIGKQFLRGPNKDKVLLRVLEKSSIYGGLSAENIEPIQLVRYHPGQYFNKHYDFLDRNNPLYKKNIEKNGQREQTFFVYLNNVPDKLGGKTHFPRIGKTFQAKKGQAIFWNNTVDGIDDKDTLHSGTELKEGIKYGLNIWVREKKYIG